MRWSQVISRLFTGREKERSDEEGAIEFLDGFWGGGKPLQISLEPYLRKFAKANTDVGSLSNYSIVMFRNGLKYTPRDFDRFYFDADYNLVLMAPMPVGFWKEQRGVACVGFTAEKEMGTITIRQLQAFDPEPLRNSHREFHRFTKELLEPIKWERMLVVILLDLVFGNGFRRVEMIRANESKWYGQPYCLKSHVCDIQGRMKMRYDVTARRMGFEDAGRRFVMTRAHYEERKLRDTGK